MGEREGVGEREREKERERERERERELREAKERRGGGGGNRKLITKAVNHQPCGGDKRMKRVGGCCVLE